MARLNLRNTAPVLDPTGKAQLILTTDTTSPGDRPMHETSSADYEIRLLHFCSIRLLKNCIFRNAGVLYRQNETG
jgi:hypothetical protein